MARAHSIWIVRDIADGYQRDPIGAFTVKHELVRWLKSDHAEPSELTITVVRDGNLKYANPLLSDWEVLPQTIPADRFLQQVRGGQ